MAPTGLFAGRRVKNARGNSTRTGKVRRGIGNDEVEGGRRLLLGMMASMLVLASERALEKGKPSIGSKTSSNSSKNAADWVEVDSVEAIVVTFDG